MNRLGGELQHDLANAPLLKALIHAKVRFVFVGGVAVAWHCAGRRADDLDLLTDPTLENASRIEEALRALESPAIDLSMLVTPGRRVALEDRFCAQLHTPVTGAPTFNAIERRAHDAAILGLSVRIASIQDLLEITRCYIEHARAQIEEHERDYAMLSGAERQPQRE